MGNAQAYPLVQLAPLQTRAPQGNAATAPWQIGNAPIVVQGIVYYPTNAILPFDGNVMAQTGIHEGVPFYADVTREPFSVVYVPVARGGMRQYERRRSDELADTTGSQTPTFPVAPYSAVPSEQRPVGTTGRAPGTVAPGTASASGTVGTLGTRRTRVESVPRPRGSDGIWIQFEGAKWYSSGGAVSYSEDRFTQVGDYRGFPVYRARDGKKNEIWIAIVKDGPLAPYAKR